MGRATAAAAIAALLLASAPPPASAARVTLSNTALPVDDRGLPLLTGEATVLAHGGLYYLYLNDWGGCPGVDCCGTDAGERVIDLALQTVAAGVAPPPRHPPT